MVDLQFDELKWRDTDPRYDINKRSNIIILRPESYGHWKAGTAHVETKEGWSIRTSFEDYRSIDDWNTDWLWCFAPLIKEPQKIE